MSGTFYSVLRTRRPIQHTNNQMWSVGAFSSTCATKQTGQTKQTKQTSQTSACMRHKARVLLKFNKVYPWVTGRTPWWDSLQVLRDWATLTFRAHRINLQPSINSFLAFYRLLLSLKIQKLQRRWRLRAWCSRAFCYAGIQVYTVQGCIRLENSLNLQTGFI
jgi:hypothetical protein